MNVNAESSVLHIMGMSAYANTRSQYFNYSLPRREGSLSTGIMLLGRPAVPVAHNCPSFSAVTSGPQETAKSLVNSWLPYVSTESLAHGQRASCFLGGLENTVACNSFCLCPPTSSACNGICVGQILLEKQ